jgi:TRAP-type C4-dicarboxylate transport system permease large subunit
MSKVAMPSMRRYGYADSLAAGSIAAGGTLGILIPPSVVLVIYGILTESDIGALFAAGIIPGIIGILFYLGAVQYAIARRPEIGPRGERVEWPERWRALRGVWGVLLLFVVVMGGIYFGIFTPTEAAGIGASFSFLFLLLRTRLTPRLLCAAWRAGGAGGLLRTTLRELATWKELREVLAETAYTTAMIFSVLIGALLFAEFVNVAGLPAGMIDFINGLDVHPYTVIFVIILIYLVLGCVFESLSMLVLTIPVLFPIVEALGFDLIWFGIVAVVVTEISLITPPIGLNVFVLRAVLPDVETKTIFKGVTPFWIADIFRLALLVAVPWFSLVLPRLFFNIG